MTERAPPVATAFERPAWIQREFDKGVFVPADLAGSRHRDAAALHRVNGLKHKPVFAPVQPQPIALFGILAGCAQGVSVAVQVAAADSREIKVVQRGVHQPVCTFLPAEGSGFDLFQHQQLPTISTHCLGQDRETFLLDWTAVEQGSRQSRQTSGKGSQSHGGTTQRSFAEVGSAHGPALLGVQEPCCTEEGVG